jgi:hypothetical protein
MILVEYIAPAYPFYLLIGAVLLFAVPLLLAQWWRDLRALWREENRVALTKAERWATMQRMWEEEK